MLHCYMLHVPHSNTNNIQNNFDLDPNTNNIHKNLNPPTTSPSGSQSPFGSATKRRKLEDTGTSSHH